MWCAEEEREELNFVELRLSPLAVKQEQPCLRVHAVMQSRTQLLTPSALRLDSRLPLELRSLAFEILPSPPSTSTATATAAGGGPPAHADGYAVASHGLTTVASSVFGPREAQRTGPWSGAAGAGAGTGAGGGGGGGATAGGAQKGDKAQVNVEVGIAAWAERVGQGAATEGGVRRAGKDRSVPRASLFTPCRIGLNELRAGSSQQADDRDRGGRQKHVRTRLALAPLPAQLDRHLPPDPRKRRMCARLWIVPARKQGERLTWCCPSTPVFAPLPPWDPPPPAALLQACINATSLALISAGLPLSDYVCSLTLASYPSLPPSGPPQIPPFELVSPPVAHTNSSDPTAMTNSGSTTLLDLVQAEEQALPALTLGVLPRSGRVTLVNLETRVGVGRFEEMLRWGVEGAKVVQAAMEEAVTSWADGLARPRKELGNLFPGLGSGGAGGAGRDGDDDDDDMDL